ncbi:Fc.00g058540.m01.CDS01 [Cosmosporella sp. VM-42]
MAGLALLVSSPAESSSLSRGDLSTHNRSVDRCPLWNQDPHTKVDLYGAMRASLLPVGGQFLAKAGAICNCLPKAFEALGKSLFQSITNGGDLSTAVTKLISEVIGLQNCVVDNGFNIKNEKVEIETKYLSPTGGWTVLRAAEIDLATYGELAAAISPCFVGGCSPKLIGEVSTNYLTKSKAPMRDQIVGVLNSWINIFDRVKAKVLDISIAADNLIAHLKTVPAKVEAVQKTVCKKGECVGPGISLFLKKASQVAATVQTFTGLQKATDRTITTVPKMVDLTRAAIDAAEVVPNATYFIQLILDGKLTKIEHILVPH